MAYSFRESRRYCRNPPYQTPKTGVPFARLVSSPLHLAGRMAAVDYSGLDKVLNLDLMKYGVNAKINNPTVGAADSVVLQRTTTFRTWLVIQNPSTNANPIFVNLDSPAAVGAVGAGFEVVPGESFFNDLFIPQGVIHVASPAGAQRIALGYCNSPPFPGS